MKSRRGLPSQWSSSPSSSLDPLTDSANTAPRNLPGAAGWDWGGRMTDGRTDFDRYCQLRRESPLTSIESFTRRRRLHLSQISSLVICLPKLHFASISALGISVMINYMNDIPSAETEVNCNLGRRITTCDTTRRQAERGMRREHHQSVGQAWVDAQRVRRKSDFLSFVRPANGTKARNQFIRRKRLAGRGVTD